MATLKPSAVEIAKELQDAYKNTSPQGLFKDLLKQTSTWEKQEEIYKAKFQELRGSEKQIAWAKKIREEKFEDFLINRVSVIWNYYTQEKGNKGFGIKTTKEDFEKTITSLSKEYKFVFSAYASEIIDNK